MLKQTVRENNSEKFLIKENCDKTEKFAIDIRNAFFEYKKVVKILENVSLQTPRGKIFALLGPSGCGKTTLIRTILGRLQLKSGSIKVFGNLPGTKYSDIPGSGVGYMPQELALFEGFQINEILRYYGIIFGLEGKELIKRIDSLRQILNLPEGSRPINKLSGGQMRRVSIAITMIHRPKLILLDEPTVGVDSILRNTIWNYLEDCCVKNGQTVLITTHYIEEAMSAANVAFMSYGTILKQSNPQTLLQEFNCQTLEAVFLQICQQINQQTKSKLSDILQESEETSFVTDEPHIRKGLGHSKSFDFNRVKAMLIILYSLTFRRPSIALIFYITPLLIISSLKIAFDQVPAHIPMVIFNEDQNPRFSQKIIDRIDKQHIDLRFAGSNQTAFESVVNGTNYMSVVFVKNFSDSFEYRVTDILQITDEELDSSQIKVYIDFSNAVLGFFGLKCLISAFNSFLRQETDLFGPNAERFFHLLSIEKPIYGEFEFRMTDVLGPGSLVATSHVYPLIVSALQIITLQKNSGLERLLVSGVRPIEILISHFILNLILISTQLLLNLFTAFGVYKITQIGSYSEVYVILFLMGIQGMAVGSSLALIMRTEIGVGLAIVILMFPLWQISGVFWPIEAIPETLRQIIMLGPLSRPIEAFRAITLKGRTISDGVVFNGFIVNIFYIIITTIFNVIFFNKLTK